jgi:uncharacterized protein YlzI (FlbEa/FlbD family)
MKARVIEIRNPPSFVVVVDAKGQRWLNAQRILSMREHKDGTLIELDNGEEFKVSGLASEIAESVQRPTVTIVAAPTDGE